jgi:hypothetical protein
MERMITMEKIVIMKGTSIDSIDEYILRVCLRIMFPECEIDIRPHPPVYSPDGEIDTEPVKNQVAL